MDVTFQGREAPDGTVLRIGMKSDGVASGKVFTYAALKAGGRWYLIGTGRVPQDAGWVAVVRWMNREGWEVVSVEVATEWLPAEPSTVRNGGHGHVVPRADGMKARCGGPALCPECTLEAAHHEA